MPALPRGPLRQLTISALLGAGATYDLQIPDLTAAIGWDTQFALKAGSQTNWRVSGSPTLDSFDGRYI